MSKKFKKTNKKEEKTMRNNLRKYLITTLSLTLVVVFSGMSLAADPPKTPAQTSNKPFQFKDDNKLLVPLTDKQRRQIKMKMGTDGRPLPQIKMDRCPDSVIHEFSISAPSCSIVHDPTRALLSYRASPPAGYRIARVKIVYVTRVPGWTGGPKRTVYDRSAAWSAEASESGITDPGPVDVEGEYKLLVTSTCLGVPRIPAITSRSIPYTYLLPMGLVLGPDEVIESPNPGGGWKYTARFQISNNVDRISFKFPPVVNDYGCVGRPERCIWTSGSRSPHVFYHSSKLSDRGIYRGVTRIYYEARATSRRCGESNQVAIARLIAHTTSSPSPEPSPTPPPPVTGTWWDLTCICTAGGIDVRNFVVPSRACLDSSRLAAAGLTCGSVVRNTVEAVLRSRGRLSPHAEVVCSFGSVQEHTADRGSCSPLGHARNIQVP